MRQIIFSAAILSLFALTTVQASSYISLGGGTVESSQQIEISLEKFMPEVSYKVTCEITDSNNEENKVIMFFDTNNSYVSGTCSLNNHPLYGYCYNKQFQLTQVENTFEVSSVRKQDFYNYETDNSSLAFMNLDQDDSVTVNCHATASAANN